MELNLNLDDADFCTNDKRSTTKIDTTYVPRQCPPNWFSNCDSEDNSDQSLLELRFKADSAFMKKNYLEAITLYNQILGEPANYKVTKFLVKPFSTLDRYLLSNINLNTVTSFNETGS